MFLAGPNSVSRSNVISSYNIILPLIAMPMIYLCGGGLWGFGIARLMNADAKSMVKACALSWRATWFRFGSGAACPWQIWDASAFVDLQYRRSTGWRCVAEVDVVEGRIGTRITAGKHESVKTIWFSIHVFRRGDVSSPKVRMEQVGADRWSAPTFICTKLFPS